MNARSLVEPVAQGYQVCVILSDTPVARSFTKSYATKGACLKELSVLGLATYDETAEALWDDWDQRGAELVYRSEASPLTLHSAGFKEQFKPATL
ncbi:hypothetical protein HDF16_002161 [Granulicella aggregans]|uniref:Uncharacterized protein n=1 Tax=Granulicella aggregans TaxID=474949 RepID=A0A7W8E4R7_9BACT|nr:hypothetical protein [Granulicella aggregans]MBB5057455.1 hypothetical protein [Granulicella aggregans]